MPNDVLATTGEVTIGLNASAEVAKAAIETKNIVIKERQQVAV
jgi:hypothetical protein